MASHVTIPYYKAIAFLEANVFPSYEEVFASIFHDPVTCMDAYAMLKANVIRKVQKERNLMSYCLLVMICQKVFYSMVRELFTCF